MLKLLSSDRRTTQVLSKEQRWLLAEMRAIKYGRIENLHIRNGRIMVTPVPRVVYEIKLCRERGSRRQIFADGFVLTASVRKMFTHIATLKGSVTCKIEIKCGLPFAMTVEDRAATSVAGIIASIKSIAESAAGSALFEAVKWITLIYLAKQGTLQ